MRSLVGILPFCLKCWSIPHHLTTLLSTPKISIRTDKNPTQMLFSTCSTSRPLKNRACSITLLIIILGNPILTQHRGILIIKPLLTLRLTLFLRPSPLPISINLYNLGVIISLGIQHESKDIHIMMEYCRTTLFFK